MKRKRDPLENDESPVPFKKQKLDHVSVPSLQDIINQTRQSNSQQHGQLQYVPRKSRKQQKKEERERKKRERAQKIEKMRQKRAQQFAAHQKRHEMTKQESRLTEEELADIKRSYLEKKPLNTRKYVKPSEKFKHSHSFEWDVDDDTSGDINPLFQNRQQAKILFGRGKRGGTDLSHQVSSGLYQPKGLGNQGSNNNNGKGQSILRRRRRRDDLNQIRSKDWRSKRLDEMNTRDWRIFREEFEIVAKGPTVPNPIRNWNEAPLHPILKDIICGLYEAPTPIQKQCIPIGLSKRDMVGIAETGSGKTAAFSIPLINKIIGKPQLDSYMMTKGPRGLILVPTRELAQQIEEEIIRLTRPTSTRNNDQSNPPGNMPHLPRVRSLVGGVSMSEQLDVFYEGCEILVATPGRLKAVLDDRKLVLTQCEFVVMDEADKMVQSDFREDLFEILENLPAQQDRVMFMFSATMPSEIEKLANTYLQKDKIFVSIGEVGRVVDRIDQRIIYIKYSTGKRRRDGYQQFNERALREMENIEHKKKKLLSVLPEIVRDRNAQVLIFVNMKKNVESLKRFLSSKKYSVTFYHGSKGQSVRSAALDGFRKGRFQILISTDLAGRGINVLTISHVINFDMIPNIETYKHRIGRTGRAGRSGKSITFITDEDELIFYDLRRLLLKCKQKIPKELNEHEASRIKPSVILKKRVEMEERRLRRDGMSASMNQRQGGGDARQFNRGGRRM